MRHTYTPWWKWPAWVWTRSFGAWPSSAEWLSAMFDYNVAPFFQSFVVVTVDPAARQITIRPWGINGPLTWKDFDRSPSVVPPGAGADAVVEWVVAVNYLVPPATAAMTSAFVNGLSGFGGWAGNQVL